MREVKLTKTELLILKAYVAVMTIAIIIGYITLYIAVEDLYK